MVRVKTVLEDSPATAKRKQFVLQLFFGLGALQSLAVLLGLLRLPSEAGRQVLFGLSAARLLLAAVLLVFALVSVYLLVLSWRSPAWLVRVTGWVNQRLATLRARTLLILICIAGAAFSLYLVLLAPEVSEPFARAYLQRLAPLFTLLGGICLQTLVLLPVYLLEEFRRAVKRSGRFLALVLGLYLFLFMVWIWMGATRTGLVPEAVGWNDLGTPILDTQLLLAWLAGIILVVFAYAGERRPGSWLSRLGSGGSQADLWISLVLYLAAVLLWWATPVPPNWFVSAPQAPNHALYPNSDALIYDTTGQSLLVGEGLRSLNEPFTRRPAYGTFLALLNGISGLAYERVVALQVLVLALLPVLLYWIGRLLHSRTGGLLAGLLVTLREANAISISGSVTVSNAKTLMADLPTALGAALFTLLAILWLQQPARRKVLPLFAGGILGLFMLIRPEIGILLPAVGVAALFQLWSRPRLWVRGMSLAVLGLVLALAPWVVRNYAKFGQVFLDSPIFRAELVVQRYSEDPAQTSNQFEPGETQQEYVERVAGSTTEFVRQNPAQVAGFVVNHLMNSEAQLALLFPNTYRVDSLLSFAGHRSPEMLWRECCSTQAYIRRLPFRQDWSGNLLQQSLLPIAANLLVLAVGFAVAWRRERFTGLLPLAVVSAYLLMHALVRNSGGRYILPVDWVSIVYYAIGIAQLTFWAAGGLMEKPVPPLAGELPQIAEPDEETGEARGAWRRLGAAALVVLLVGCLVPFSERMVAPRFTSERHSAMIGAVLQSNTLPESSRTGLADFLAEGGGTIAGRALYPRFFASGEGDSYQETGLTPREYSFLGMYLVGPYSGGIVLPHPDGEVELPNGADVLVFGCPVDRWHWQALAVAVFPAIDSTEPVVYWRSSDAPELVCPPPAASQP
jgi:hypothetical protein